MTMPKIHIIWILALSLFHWLDVLILGCSKMAAKSTIAKLKTNEFKLFAESLSIYGIFKSLKALTLTCPVKNLHNSKW